MITDENGALVQQIRYNAYGEVRARLAADGSASDSTYRYEFTGYESESSSGLAYAGARFYDPALGMFLSHDPAHQFASPYSYGDGDPVNGTDPSGASWEAVVILFVIGFVIGFGISAAQASANGADTAASLKAGAIGGAIGGATTVLLAPLVGPTGWVAETLGPIAGVIFDAALVGAGGYSSYQSFAAGQMVAGAAGAIFAAMGAYGLLQRGRLVAQGASGQGGGQFAADSSSLSDAENDVRSPAEQFRIDSANSPIDASPAINAPPGAGIQANIRAAQQHNSLSWFRDQVRNHGPLGLQAARSAIPRVRQFQLRRCGQCCGAT